MSSRCNLNSNTIDPGTNPQSHLSHRNWSMLSQKTTLGCRGHYPDHAQKLVEAPKQGCYNWQLGGGTDPPLISEKKLAGFRFFVGRFGKSEKLAVLGF